MFNHDQMHMVQCLSGSAIAFPASLTRVQLISTICPSALEQSRAAPYRGSASNLAGRLPGVPDVPAIAERCRDS